MTIKNSVLRSLAMALTGLQAWSFAPGMALGLEEEDIPPGVATELPQQVTKAGSSEETSESGVASAPSAGNPETLAETAPEAVPSSFVSQGQPYELAYLGLKLTPPQGWEVSSQSGGLSLIMKEPRDPKPSYDEPKYQRNLTMATIHQPSPIDEKRAKALEAELVKSYSQDSAITDFKIVEHKFFNYRGEGDGLLFYSSMTIGDYPMMMMHVLLGGKNKQFLFTYTDLASRFSSGEDAGYKAAWNTMATAEVLGDAPSRFSTYMPYFVSAGILLFAFASIFWAKYRANRRDYKLEADRMMEHSYDSGAETSRHKTELSAFSALSGFGSFASVGVTGHGSHFRTHL